MKGARPGSAGKVLCSNRRLPIRYAIYGLFLLAGLIGIAICSLASLCEPSVPMGGPRPVPRSAREVRYQQRLGDLERRIRDLDDQNVPESTLEPLLKEYSGLVTEFLRGDNNEP
jgi:hypothetical protein